MLYQCTMAKKNLFFFLRNRQKQSNIFYVISLNNGEEEFVFVFKEQTEAIK